MGCTCPPPGDKGRGEFVLTRERVPRMELQHQCPESPWLFPTAREKKQIFPPGAVRYVPAVSCGSQLGHKEFD